MRLQSILSHLARPQRLLISGILVRCITFIFLDPKNVDGHWQVLEFIVQNGRLPHSGEVGQAYHPPLYYLLASPILRWTGNLKAVQVLSLALSVLSLLVLYRLIYRTGLISSSRLQQYSFLLVCFLPQFVMYGLFVSNDTLTILLGCCTVLALVQFVNSPGAKSLAVLTLLATAGLLCKATFLAYVPILAAVVLVVGLQAASKTRALAATGIFLVLVICGGSYKFIDNYRYYHQAFISNIDFHPDWAQRQLQFHRGAASYLNFNLAYLLSSPSYSSITESAYPLMLYATFWYQHVPESNFIGCTHKPFTYLAAAMYVAGFMPSLLLGLGIVLLAIRLPHFARTFQRARETDRKQLIVYAAVALFLGNLGLMITAVMKYHVWSIMQGRLLFPSSFGMLAAFATGNEVLEKRPRLLLALELCIVAVVVLSLLYLGGENLYQFVSHVFPGFKEYVKTLRT